MNLKRRLIISNAAVVIIPIIITIVASFVFIFISSNILNTDIKYENIKKFASMEYELLKINSSTFQNNPERLMEKEYQQYLAAQLSGMDAHAAIIRNNSIVFSTKPMNKIDVEKCIEASRGGLSQNFIELDTTTYMVKSISVSFTNGEKGWVILLAPVSREEAVSEKFLLFVVIIFLISFVIANSIYAYSFSKKIVQPISRLKAAAGEISRGNLDYQIIEEEKDEIGELCRSFEQMRLKLKESVYTQMKYEDNRKMLVSSISHDLKTPITSIKGYVEGIADGVANTPEKIEKYLSTIYSKAMQVDRMIDDLLLYSKLDLKQIPFDFEETDIVRYFEDSILENAPELEKSNIQLTFHNNLKEHSRVMIDRERLRRVVNNIIDNARKYLNTPEGRINIILRESGSNIIIEISDNGSGIPRQDLPHVFDRFYRADASRSKAAGSGLGLAIAKQIVEGHGGKIWVRSIESEGTSIMISLQKLN